jgi:hypothetical protein
MMRLQVVAFQSTIDGGFQAVGLIAGFNNKTGQFCFS